MRRNLFGVACGELMVVEPLKPHTLTGMSHPLLRDASARYYKGMKLHTKSSITLPPAELRLVTTLQRQLGAKSKVEVVRRGLLLLRETTERNRLREAYRQASATVRDATLAELTELDGLTTDGLGDE
jgi:hypothetical protein